MLTDYKVVDAIEKSQNHRISVSYYLYYIINYKLFSVNIQ